jgi:hypothetical protein
MRVERPLEIANKLAVEITERGVPDKIGVDAINCRSCPRALVAWMTWV